jgi:DNA-binding NarL/FixJ family response regulator
VDKPISLVIADDDQFVSASLNTILSAQPDIMVLAIGADGLEAESLFLSHQPGILLIDIQMPKRSGLEAAEAILNRQSDARIVLLTTFSDDDYIIQAIRLGVKGYLIKQDVLTIAPALRLVMAGQSVLGSEVVGRMEHLLSGSRTSGLSTGLSDPQVKNPLTVLTAREYEVTELVARGLDNREIASSLYISEGTVRNLISTILQKLELKNRTQLAVLFYRGNP